MYLTWHKFLTLRHKRSNMLHEFNQVMKNDRHQKYFLYLIECSKCPPSALMDAVSCLRIMRKLRTDFRFVSSSRRSH